MWDKYKYWMAGFSILCGPTLYILIFGGDHYCPDAPIQATIGSSMIGFILYLLVLDQKTEITYLKNRLKYENSF